MGIVVQGSREILHRNPFPAGDPRHRAAGDAVLEALLAGTDAEGFSGDRTLMNRARAWLESRWSRDVAVGEAYRLRSADRVEALFVREEGPRAIAGMPGRFETGLVHAVEVTRENALAFRTSPCWRRAGGRGWILVDAGDEPATPRSAARDALEARQTASLEHGVDAESRALASVAASGTLRVDAAHALRSTSLPRTIRDRAAALLSPMPTLADVLVALADVAGGCDREEGETYARAAGRLALAGAAVAAGPAAP